MNVCRPGAIDLPVEELGMRKSSRDPFSDTFKVRVDPYFLKGYKVVGGVGELVGYGLDALL